ncbi:hypothetical protein ACLOJK_024450 [Asimina triloba]
MARLVSAAVLILALAYVAHSARINKGPSMDDLVKQDEKEKAIVDVVTEPPPKDEEDVPIVTPSDGNWKLGLSIYAPVPEMDLDAKCISTLTDKCASQLSLALIQGGYVNDFTCCWKMIRLGNVCWGSLIETFQDQCHNLPLVIQRCKNITHFVNSPAKPTVTSQLKYSHL